jgi:hypothetical protein
MKGAALPSPNCCEQLKPYTDARCPCLPGYQQILPIGGFDKAYFEGATTILALACRISFAPCEDTGPVPASVPPAAANSTGVGLSENSTGVVGPPAG